MNCNIAVIKGDGIGPEVVTQAMKVLDAVGEKFGHTFNYEQLLMGGCSIDACGEPLTDEAVERAKARLSQGAQATETVMYLINNANEDGTLNYKKSEKVKLSKKAQAKLEEEKKAAEEAAQAPEESAEA